MIKFFLVAAASFGVFCGMLMFRCSLLQAVIGGCVVMGVGIFGGK